MPFKPNYNHQRAERDRAKQAKKAEKLAAKKDQSARRAAGLEDGPLEEGALPPATGEGADDDGPQALDTE